MASHGNRLLKPSAVCKTFVLVLFIPAALLLFLLGVPDRPQTGSQNRKLDIVREATTAATPPSSYDALSREGRFYLSGAENGKEGDRRRKEDNGEEERTLEPHGSAAALFVLYGAYRGGSNTFAVVGLGYKPLYLFAEPEFECYWIPAGHANNSTSTPNLYNAGMETQSMIKSESAYAMLPDYGYGRVYTTVVVNCTFSEAVGIDAHQRGTGGQLVLLAYHGDDVQERPAERFVALTEDERSYNASMYEPPYQYDYLYCGSPLFGHLNADRMREWIAYHIWLFGPRSHFVFHDAGGMHAEVRAALAPWQKLGYVSVQNVKQQAQYDAYYYNQFLINNDCLHRTKFMANWTFFFDVDEFIYIPPSLTLPTVMSWYHNATMLRFAQLRMSDVLCQHNSSTAHSRPWAFEKLVYGETINDMKYAVQARKVFATGVHYSQIELGHMEGEVGWANWPEMRFYHYHNTINQHGEICQVFAGNATTYSFDEGSILDLDTSMVSLGPLVKQFELEKIGNSRLRKAKTGAK